MFCQYFSKGRCLSLSLGFRFCMYALGCKKEIGILFLNPPPSGNGLIVSLCTPYWPGTLFVDKAVLELESSTRSASSGWTKDVCHCAPSSFSSSLTEGFYDLFSPLISYSSLHILRLFCSQHPVKSALVKVARKLCVVICVVKWSIALTKGLAFSPAVNNLNTTSSCALVLSPSKWCYKC